MNSSCLSKQKQKKIESDFIICRKKLPVRKDERRISSAALCSLFWAIWKERNEVVFEDDVLSLSRLKSVLFIFFCVHGLV